MQRALVSIHDVMPCTLDRVQQLIDVARRQNISRLTLLVTPGVGWTSAEMDRLRRWRDSGYQLAGHGWKHRCDTVRGWRHRLHSWLISRNVAEHLATTGEGCVEIMRRCGDWFSEQGLQVPALYVPPAWALGDVSRAALRQTPFSLLEMQTGVVNISSGSLYLLPLVGFEADTAFRTWALRSLNAANTALATVMRRPLRVALHPDDLQLRLAPDVLRSLGRSMRALHYGELPPAGRWESKRTHDSQRGRRPAISSSSARDAIDSKA